MTTPIINKPGSSIRIEMPDGSGVVFLLRVPTIDDRVAYKRELSRRGGKTWSELEMLDTLAEGLRNLMTEPEEQTALSNLLAEIEQRRTAITEFGREVLGGKFSTKEEAENLARRWDDLAVTSPVLREVERGVFDSYQPYADRVSDRATYDIQCGVTAARMFLTGWENKDAEFKVGGRDRTATNETLLLLSDDELLFIGARAREMLEPPAERLKKLQSLIGGSASPPPSGDESGTPPNGHSQTETSSPENPTGSSDSASTVTPATSSTTKISPLPNFSSNGTEADSAPDTSLTPGVQPSSQVH